MNDNPRKFFLSKYSQIGKKNELNFGKNYINNIIREEYACKVNFLFRFFIVINTVFKSRRQRRRA